MNVGKSIRQFREKMGITRKELAEKASLSVSSVHYIESGTNSPTVQTLQKIAVALDVNMAELLDNADDLKPSVSGKKGTLPRTG